jgi:hypothetical protein
MRNYIAGASNFENQPLKEIYNDLINMVDYSIEIVNKNKKLILDLENQADLIGIFLEIIYFAEKVLENSNKNLKKVKKGIPDINFCDLLIKMGTDAKKINMKIGLVWNGENHYSMMYDDSSVESKEYCLLRDYIVSMIDLNNIGYELKDRFFKDNKPIYKEKNRFFNIFIVIYNLTIRAILDKIF